MNEWFGDTINFGDTVKYICDRNHFFKDESIDYFELECLSENETRGYFNAPNNSSEWPPCVFTKSCPDPPPPPANGSMEIVKPKYEVHQHSICGIQESLLSLSCPSFSSILIMSSFYGRKAGVKLMCDGRKLKAPTKDCNTTYYQRMLYDECHGHDECSIQVPVNPRVCGSGFKTEMEVTYSCVVCYPWHTLITDNDQCIDTFLVYLKRLDKDDLATTHIANKKFMLRKLIIERLDDTFYTQTKLHPL